MHILRLKEETVVVSVSVVEHVKYAATTSLYIPQLQAHALVVVDRALEAGMLAMELAKTKG